MNDTVHNLVAAIKTGDALTTEQAFAAAMAEKLSTKIEDLRIATAQNMFNQVTEAKAEEDDKEDDKEEKQSEDDKETDKEDKESEDDKEDK